jgi:hypothetical protein
MANAGDIRWFKEHFHAEIEAKVAGTVFDLDMLTAIACQETGEIWPVLRQESGLSVAQIVALCVGDTLDRGRTFPRNKRDLISAPDGQKMFDIARKALVDMAVHIRSYQGAAAHPDKFVKGFGIWQFDLQFFKAGDKESDPEFFLDKKYEQVAGTLDKAIIELREALKKTPFANKPSLSDVEMASVAIAYNTGSFKPSRGLNQGFQAPGDPRTYGEHVFDFIRLSKTVPVPGGTPSLPAPPPGRAIVPAPTPVTATGPAFVVDTRQDPLRLRSAPEVSDPPGENVIALLPDGQPVQAITGQPINGFMEVETNLFGAHFVGFAFAELLKPVSAQEPVTPPGPISPEEALVSPVTPQRAPAATPIPQVFMPQRPGTITRRSDPADAHSLNEPDQPGRQGTTPADLVAELNAIIEFLGVDNPAHQRYQPHDGLTFCNIYVHDFCHLAGVYIPRVWWTQRAIIEITQGNQVEPLIGDTIDELRANDLFRWLRDFGSRFEWRQTGTLDKLQQNANQGGLSIIVARRKQDGKSGHIVMVVPEGGRLRARRNPGGEVIAPLQSQAGATNFRRGTSTLNWWNDDRFAESAFWIHA